MGYQVKAFTKETIGGEKVEKSKKVCEPMPKPTQKIVIDKIKKIIKVHSSLFNDINRLNPMHVILETMISLEQSLLRKKYWDIVLKVLKILCSTILSNIF